MFGLLTANHRKPRPQQDSSRLCMGFVSSISLLSNQQLIKFNSIFCFLTVLWLIDGTLASFGCLVCFHLQKYKGNSDFESRQAKVPKLHLTADRACSVLSHVPRFSFLNSSYRFKKTGREYCKKIRIYSRVILKGDYRESSALAK